MNSLEQNIEALLFYKAEPISIKELGKLLGAEENDIRNALEALSTSLKDRGLSLMMANDEAELRTAPQTASLIETLQKEELSRELGRAAGETLSIVLYEGPVSRSDIDFIRGVNSTFILRSLMIRGLIERTNNPKDGRGFTYRPTHELLAHLGITRIEDLPEYEKIRDELKTFRKTQTDDHEAL